MKKLLKLMKKNPDGFNKYREEENYPKIVIRNKKNLKLKKCNLKNIVFEGCSSVKLDQCDNFHLYNYSNFKLYDCNNFRLHLYEGEHSEYRFYSYCKKMILQ